MEFIWNDGGRAASGFVGLAGDCVTRAITIATGIAYREVYAALGEVAQESPRDGIERRVFEEFLESRGWARFPGQGILFCDMEFPKGVVVAHVRRTGQRCGHVCAVIDSVVHDTWNATEDDDYVVLSYWTSPDRQHQPGLLAGGRPLTQQQTLTQQEFDKILRRLRALDNTAGNDASTEGEKRNALRMMQDLMLRHNLTREDIVDDDNVEHVLFTRIACPVNGRRACGWELSLANYVTLHVFPTVQWYRGTLAHRSMYWFYGPKSDVENTIALFRELLLTIASSATLQYGGYVRGSGASYAEGYVAGLPREATPQPTPAGETQPKQTPQAGAQSGQPGLIHARTLILKETAAQWLYQECGLRLVTTRRQGRYQHDPDAATRGKQHGATHKLDVPGSPRRLTYGG
jgi:hypothetical protein